MIAVNLNQTFFKEVARVEKGRFRAGEATYQLGCHGMYKFCYSVRFAPAANKLWVSPECRLRNCIHKWLSA